MWWLMTTTAALENRTPKNYWNELLAFDMDSCILVLSLIAMQINNWCNASMHGNRCHLDPADVVVVAEERPEAVDGLPRGAAGRVGDAERDERAHPVGPEQAEAPGHERAPVVRRHEHLALAERVEERHQVPHHVQRGVLRGRIVVVVAAPRRRRVGAAVPAQVRRHGAVPGRGQRPHLVAPGVPQLREAVQQQHRGRASCCCCRRRAAGLRHVQAHAGAQLHGAVGDGACRLVVVGSCSWLLALSSSTSKQVQRPRRQAGIMNDGWATVPALAREWWVFRCVARRAKASVSGGVGGERVTYGWRGVENRV
jgi:hypothetical protein